jgi:hypothetical protein
VWVLLKPSSHQPPTRLNKRLVFAFGVALELYLKSAMQVRMAQAELDRLNTHYEDVMQETAKLLHVV